MYGEDVLLGAGFFLNMGNNFESIISNGGTGSSGIFVVENFTESFAGEHFMAFGWKYSQKLFESKNGVVRMVKMMARISKTKVPTNIFVKVFAIVSEQGLIVDKEMDVSRYISEK